MIVGVDPSFSVSPQSVANCSRPESVLYFLDNLLCIVVVDSGEYEIVTGWVKGISCFGGDFGHHLPAFVFL